jgi:hypothetical protein
MLAFQKRVWAFRKLIIYFLILRRIKPAFIHGAVCVAVRLVMTKRRIVPVVLSKLLRNSEAICEEMDRGFAGKNYGTAGSIDGEEEGAIED